MYRCLLLFILLLLPLSVQAEPSDRPLQVLHALGCKACHRFQGQGGTFAQPLDPQPSHPRTIRQLSRQLSRPARSGGAAPMPPYRGITSEQLDALGNLLTPPPAR